MAALRFLAAVFALIATITLVADVTQFQATGTLVLTSVAAHWALIAPATLPAAQEAVGIATAPWVWDEIISPLLSIPTCVLAALLAVASGYAGRRRRRVQIFTN